MSGPARKRTGRRWSATSSVELFDATGAPVGDGPAPPVRAVVRWRLDGKSRSRTFAGNDLAEVSAFRALLRMAYEEDWAADDRHRPLRPHAGTVPSAEQPAGPTPIARAVPDPSPADDPTPFALPGLGVPRAAAPGSTGLLRDVDDLVTWQLAHLKTTLIRRKGTLRRGITTGGYESNLAWIARHARYRAGDPRLDALGLEPGASLRLDAGEELGLNDGDLIALIDLRAATNERTRAANARAMRTWAADVVKQEGQAKREGRPLTPPPTPTLKPERVSGRTIEECCRTLKSALNNALRRRRIDYLAWTPEVDDEVVHAESPSYTTKSLPNRDQVRRLAATMAALERPGRDAQGRPVTLTGDRYEAMVVVAARQGPRPEETIAMRRSWFELDLPRPRIVVHNAEVYEPLDGGGRQRTVVSLKHRGEGEHRYLYLDDPDEVALYRRHLDTFVAAPAPAAEDPEARDPHAFTTHLGAPVELANFGDWWHPAVEAAFTSPADKHLRCLQFRQLRAAAITGWLVAGMSLDACARKAGNSQLIIERHYKGVLDEIEYDHHHDPAADPTSPPTAELGSLSEVELATIRERAGAEIRRRLDSDST